MPNAVGSTGDLYAGEGDAPINTPQSSLYPPNVAPAGDVSKNLGASPSAPAPVPPPTVPVRETTTVVVKSRMADETPDGKVRDTSMEALRPGNDLGFRNLDDESMAKPAAEAPPMQATEPKPTEVKPATPSPAPEKVYAGKFKTPEDLEKSYQELERKLTQTSQEKAELARKAAEAPPPPVPKTPQQVAAEETRKNEILQQFVNDPEKFLQDRDQRSQQQTYVALKAQQAREQWVKDNPDLAQSVEIEGTKFSGEDVVAILAVKMAQGDASLAATPDVLLSKATTIARQYFGTIRTEAAKEALTTETRVIPLLQNTAPAATEQPSQKAPLTADDAFNVHIRMLKEQEQKSHRGLRR